MKGYDTADEPVVDTVMGADREPAAPGLNETLNVVLAFAASVVARGADTEKSPASGPVAAIGVCNVTDVVLWFVIVKVTGELALVVPTGEAPKS